MGYRPRRLLVSDALAIKTALVRHASHTRSENGDAWSHFTHDDARSRAFRWGEDGIAGVCDSHGLLNIAFSFWNEEESVSSRTLPT